MINEPSDTTRERDPSNLLNNIFSPTQQNGSSLLSRSRAIRRLPGSRSLTNLANGLSTTTSIDSNNVVEEGNGDGDGDGDNPDRIDWVNARARSRSRGSRTYAPQAFDSELIDLVLLPVETSVSFRDLVGR